MHLSGVLLPFGIADKMRYLLKTRHRTEYTHRHIDIYSIEMNIHALHILCRAACTWRTLCLCIYAMREPEKLQIKMSADTQTHTDDLCVDFFCVIIVKIIIINK